MESTPGFRNVMETWFINTSIKLFKITQIVTFVKNKFFRPQLLHILPDVYQVAKVQKISIFAISLNI